MTTTSTPKFLQFLLLPFFVFVLNVGWGQIAGTTALSIPSTSTLINTVGSYAGTAATLPTYWSQSASGTNGNNQAGTNQATGTAGGWYGSGVSNAGGMSFLGSGTATNGNGTICYQNNTGSTITGFTLAYTAKMFKSGSGSPTVTVSWTSSGSIAAQPAGSLANSLASLGFSDATTSISSGTTLTQSVSSISIANGQYIYVRWICSGGSSSDNLGWNNIAFTAVTAAPSPTITGTATATAFTTTYGTASAAQTFAVSGTNLTANLVATAPSGFEVSSDGTTYGSTATFTQTSGSASGTLSIRVAATALVGGTYNSKNIVLSSTGATSVNITTAASGNTVSAKALTITGLSAANKNYDGNTTVSVTGTAAYSGLVNSESFTPSDVVTWAFPDANVGTNKVLTRTGTFSAPSANYTVTQPSLTANINAIVSTAPSITGITAGNAQLSVAFTAPNSNGGSSITNYEYSIDGGTSFSPVSPAQTASPILVTGLTNGTTYNVQIRAVNIAGSGAASSTVQGTPEAPANPLISVAPSAFASAFSNTYGTASSTQTITVSGAALTSDLTITAPTGFEISLLSTSGFSASLTLTQSSGTVSNTLIYVRLASNTSAGMYNNAAVTVSGGGASSVSISTTSSGNVVSTKSLTITGISASNKSYDGTTTASLTGTASYVGLANGESFSVTGTPTAVFATANAGSGIAVTVTGFTAPSSNYTLTQPTLTANITTVNLTISGISISNKVYNGNTTATIAGTATYLGFVNSESFPVTGTPLATFSSSNVGTGISVTVSGYTAPTANYTVTQPTGLSADITKANQTITFGALANQTTATVTDYSPGATSATSGTNAITYTSSNTSVATIVGGLIHIVGAGTTTITASQAASANYYAASDVSQSLVVTLAPVVVVAWQFGNPASLGTETSYGSTTLAGNMASVNLNRGTGVSSTALGRAYAASGWDANATKANSVTNNEYFEFILNSGSGYNFSLYTLDATLRRSGSTAPNAYIWRYSLDGINFLDIGTDISFTSTADGVAQSQISLSNISALQNCKTATFRLYAWGGSSNTATFSIGRYATGVTTNSLSIGGNVFLDKTPPILTADVTSNTVDNNIDISFTDDASWRTAITSVKIGSTALTPTTDYIISAGNIQLKPSGLNALLTVAGTKSVTVVATGYSDATVTQVIGAGVPTSNSTASISSILAAGASRTITCTAKDQYNNLVSGYTFKYDATVVASNATTTESYVIDGSTTTSTLSDINLTTTTNASGVVTFPVQLPSIMDANDGISVQVQLTSGITNIGSAFAYYELPGQTITFNALTPVTYGDAAFTLSASGGASGNPVVFTSSNNAVATCTGTNGSTVTIIGVGSATITASQAGNAGFNAAAPVSQTLTVNQKALTISGITGANKVYNGTAAATFTGTPAYVGLVNGENFSVSGTATATFSDANVGIGKTIIVVGYTAPSANYSLTQPTLTGDITQASQTISFASLPNRMVGGSSYSLNLNASSGLPITYESSNTSVVSVSGNTVTIVGVGTATITASQVGNNNYSAATSVIQTQTIIATPIAAWDFFGQSSPATFAATTFNSNLDGTSGLNSITRGAGAPANSAANSFSTTGFQNDGISTSNTDYFQVTMKASSGYSLSLSEINANFDGTGGTNSFYAAPGVTSQYAYSLDGTNFTLIGSPVISTSLKPAALDLSGVSALQNVSSSFTVTIRYYASGQTTTGGWRFSSPAAGVPGLAIGGSICQLPSSLSLSSTSFCNNGETSTISSLTSEIGVTYDLYDSNGIISNTSKSGTGNALSWSGISQGTYYVMGTRDAGSCSSSSQNIILTAVIPTYSYYTDNDSDGFGIGTVHLNCSASAPTGYSALNTDCNDNNAAISPGTAEICGDGIDNNCDNNESYPSQYRSAVTTGDWSDASTWEKYCNAGGSWTAAQIAPSNQYFNASVPFAVTVQSGHTVTVSTTSTTNFAKAGSLTVAGNLIVNGNLTVTSSVINSGNVTINHGASFVQSSENTTNSGNGNFIVNMNLTGANNGTTPTGRYWYLGSPMNNTVASLFFDQQKMVRLWIYEPSNNSWVTLINSSTTASGATNSTLLVPGMGYLYRAGSDKTIQFTGDATKFNNNITTPLSFTGTGYKYVANPYTSHIDWRLVTRTGLNVSYWIRNATNTAYEAYNATSGVSTPTGTQTTQFIPPMQGFWIYAYTTPCSLRMDNGDRTHSNNLLHAPEHNQIVRLNLNDGKTDDQAVVYENENASNGIEEYDTDKFMDENHHQVYFLEGTKQLTLDGLKDATAKQKVDMGIQITSAGTYTINAVELGVEEDVVLEDKFTHTFQDLKRNNTYIFTSNGGTYNNRFVLHFTLNPQTETATESVAVTEEVAEVDGVSVYTTTGQQVKVWVTNNTEFQNATVKVYDAVGNMIERKNMTSSELLLDLDTATGVYLVEVVGTDKSFTKKVFVTK